MFLGKCSKWNLNFQVWLKSFQTISEPTKRLACENLAYALRNRQVKQGFVKENEKKMNELKTRSLNLRNP